MRSGLWLSGWLQDKHTLRRLAVDLTVAGLLAALTFLCALQVQQGGFGARGVWRRSAAPAVMYALGHGYVNPDLPEDAPLQDFLSAKRDGMARSDFPGPIPLKTLDLSQRRWRWLLMPVALYWRTFGVTWSGLAPFFAAWGALAAAAAYALLRAALPRIPAACASALWATSPVQLVEVTSYRDYSKAPFFFLALCLLVVAVRFPLSPRLGLLLAAAEGLLIAVGIRFRYDPTILVPLTLLVFLALMPGAWRGTWKTRCGMCLVFLLIYLSCSWSYNVSNAREGSNSAHNLAMGLTHEFEERLGVGGVPYDHGLKWNDSLTNATLASYGRRMLGVPTDFYYTSSGYDTVGKAYLTENIKTFPADRLLFAYAAILRNLNELPFQQEEMYLPHPSVWPVFIQRLYDWRWRCFGFLYGWGAVLTAIAALTLAAWQFRLGLAATLIVLYVNGYTALQYDIRHAFHAEVFLWWAVAWLGTLGILALRRRRDWRTTLSDGAWKRPALRAGALAVLLLAGLAGPLWVARVYQAQQVAALRASYLSAGWVPVKAEGRAFDDNARPVGSVLLSLDEGLFTHPPNNPPALSHQSYDDYLGIELQGTGEPIALRLHYPSHREFADLSREFLVPAGAPGVGSTFVFAPVYRVLKSEELVANFAGVGVRARDQRCIVNIFRASDPAGFPLYPNIRLQEGGVDTGQRWLTLQRKPLPYSERKRTSHARNLVAAGDFEGGWERGAEIQCPRTYSRVVSVQGPGVHGQFALKQTWQSGDGSASVGDQFGLRFTTPKPGTAYELLLRCRNSTDKELIVSAFQVSEPDAPPVIERLQYALISIPPNRGLQEYAGIFHTTAVEGMDVLLTAFYKGATPGAEAIWDDWRLCEVLY